MNTTSKITPESIEKQIVNTTYLRVADTTLTICVLTMKNNFCVTGESACIFPDMFDKQMGRDLAYKKAFEKCWALEGYRLADLLYNDR